MFAIEINSWSISFAVCSHCGSAGPAPAELRSAPPGLGSSQAGPTWLGSTWPSLAWFGFGSDRAGLDWPGPALISSARHASAPGLLGPALLSLARLGSRLGSFSRYCNISAAELQVTEKNKLLRPARLDSSRLGSAWLGWDVARLTPVQPGLAWPDSGLDVSAWQLGGSDGLGLAQVGSLVTALHVSAEAWLSP